MSDMNLNMSDHDNSSRFSSRLYFAFPPPGTLNLDENISSMWIIKSLHSIILQIIHSLNFYYILMGVAARCDEREEF